MKTSIIELIESIRRHLNLLPPPESLLGGVKIGDAFAPDNLLIFRHSHTHGGKPDGTSSNYHHRFEFVTALGNPGAMRIDPQTFELHPGESALIFPNQFHRALADAELTKEWVIITFDLAHPEPILGLRDKPRVLDEAALQLLADLLQEYVEPRGPQRDHLFLAYTFSRLLMSLVTLPEIPVERRSLHSGNDVRDVLLDKISSYVRANLHKSVTIGDMAEALGYSVSHLRAVFRDGLGVSLGRYMRESRLCEAAKLLQGSTFNVSEIGERCGFESLYAFSRGFRRAYGLPPRAYRNLVRAGAPLPEAKREPKQVETSREKVRTPIEEPTS